MIHFDFRLDTSLNTLKDILEQLYLLFAHPTIPWLGGHFLLRFHSISTKP